MSQAFVSFAVCRNLQCADCSVFRGSVKASNCPEFFFDLLEYHGSGEWNALGFKISVFSSVF